MRVFEKNSNIFKLLSEAVSEGIIVINEEQLIVAANTRASAMFGYENEALVGEPLEVLIPQTYSKAHQTHVSGFYRKHEQRRMAEGRTLFGLRKNKDQFPLEVGLNPFVLYGNTYVLALVIDVTERKKIEESQKMKTAALEAALNGITITDALQEDNPIIYANTAFEKITGYAKEEILGRNCRFLQAGDHDQEAVKKMYGAIKEGKGCHVQLRNYKKDGTLFWNEVSINPIADESERITHYVGIQNDITERKMAEQEIGHLARIFDESLNEIYVFDAHTLQFINANYGAQKNTGYVMAECKKMTPLDLKPEFSEDKFRKLISPLLDGSMEKMDFETVHRRKDGTTYPVEVHLQISSLGDKQVIVAIILDISDRKDYTQKLEKTVERRTEQLKKALETEKELNDLKTKFLSLVSHEFKTPLSGILTSTILVGKYTEKDQQEKREKHLKTITGMVHHLTQILDDFLSMEQLEKGKEVYHHSEFSLSKLVNEVIYNANMLLKNGQRINYPQNIDDVSICQDEKIMALVLTNLLTNAVKYSQEDTEIDLKVDLMADKIIIHVKDQGIGIPEKDQKHIFDRYFRAENVLTTQGTGIGLNMIKAHVENLGGSIFFISKQNKGSTFTVELPLGKAP
ncbi:MULTISPECIES: PAS domain-containing sensor histidine kinase [Flagellimonas]|uniref:histidine kinase n=2 Tax=Flagellimonas TaxID=444459 RepID=A0A3A1ND84_9FLAO|nr:MULTISPECIES: PAS domain-containing sensor histidine kinase [Allomuricauda]MBW8242792.1 PAS domain S-box protein [Allomuricauda oceani]QII45473.1 PAS domain S-box protein [Allomuricauda oceani]RIV42421.1 PAS domain S-box protein [Allomuricauda maritima]TXJ91451.1 PAS domain S-box protein [Allomuricauda maritima]